MLLKTIKYWELKENYFMNYFQLLWKVVTNTNVLFKLSHPIWTQIKENLREFFKLKQIFS